MVSPMNMRAIREMSPEERKAKLKETREELMNARGHAAGGGAPPSPGKLRAMRTSVARLFTVMKEKGDKVE